MRIRGVHRQERVWRRGLGRQAACLLTAARSPLFHSPRAEPGRARALAATAKICDLAGNFKPAVPRHTGLTGRRVWKCGRQSNTPPILQQFFQAERPRPRKGRVGCALDTGQPNYKARQHNCRLSAPQGAGLDRASFARTRSRPRAGPIQTTSGRAHRAAALGRRRFK